MPKHIIRLVLLLAGLLVVAIIAKGFFTDPSFYKYGTYRADSVPAIAAPTPKIRGPEHCQSCHVDRHAEWSAGGHHNVNCEICHGTAAREHPDNYKLPIPEDTITLCTQCHEKMPSRPAAQPQIVVAEHPFPHEGDLQCKTCHNPHSPRIGGPRPGPTAAEATVAPEQKPAEVVAVTPPSEKAPKVVAPTEKKPVAKAVAAETVAAPAPEPVTEKIVAPASAASCSGCHGAEGQGMGTFPALAGKDADHFTTQIGRYKSGDRTDPMGMMGMIAKGLSDEDTAALARYYESL